MSSSLSYVKPQILSLKGHANFDEKRVHDHLAEDPSLLGLGDLVLIDRERRQPGAGRLDLLLQNSESDHRYEVEIQLGRTDESHIIRTIEYWDIERRRFPHYEHTAVIVAEVVTSRFLNVISLFNRSVPLVAIQMQALQLGGQVSLLFTTVLDQQEYGETEEEEELAEPTDRAYWEKRTSSSNLAIIDLIFQEIRKLDGRLEPRYKRGYVGVGSDGSTRNFVVLKSRRNFVWIEPKLARTTATDSALRSAGFDDFEYTDSWGRYRIRVRGNEASDHLGTLMDLIKRAYEAWGD